MSTSAPQRKSLFAQVQSGPRSETFPIHVIGYDTQSAVHTVTGTRLDNGEQVSVHLRDIELKKNAKYQRPSIADFEAPRQFKTDPGTVPGGVLMIEEAQKVADGVYSSRWIRSLSHTPEEAEVMIVTAHCTGLRHAPGGRPYAGITFLHDGNINHLSQDMCDALLLTGSGQVGSTEALQSALLEMVQSNIGAGVRIKMGDVFDSLYVSARKGVEPEKVVEDFMKRVPQPVADSINSGEALCEVIPYGQLWAGPATVEIMEKSATVQARMDRYFERVERPNGQDRDVQLFRPSIVAMRMTKPDPQTGMRGVYVTHIEPLNTRPPVQGLREAICYASTESFAPEVPRPASKARNDEPAQRAPVPPEAQGHGQDFDADQDFSAGAESTMPISEEDIMAAAGQDFGIEDFSAAPGAPDDDIGESAPRVTRGRRMNSGR